MIKGIITMTKLENVSIRKISKNNTAKTITIPGHWGEVGQSVCVAVKDENTLIVTKRLR